MKVTVMMAVTVDGRIGKDSDHLADWSEKADKSLFRQVTKDAGVLVMGSKTFDTIGRPLPGRKNIILTRKKDRLSDHEDLIFTDTPPKKLIIELEEQGFSHIVVGGGAAVNSLFFRAGLVDELIITISPVIFGKGLSLFEEDIEMNLELKECERLGDNSLKLRYRVVK